MPFIGKVALEPIREAGFFDRGLWRTTEPLIYKSKRHDATISVPVDFKTDLASVPRFLPIINALAGGTGVRAAVIHDYIYYHPVYFNGERQMLPRDVGDDIFDEIMEEDKVPGWRKALMWAGVRVGGWTAYGEEEN